MTKITGRNINFEGDTPSSGDGVQIISNQGIKPLKNNLSASDAPDSGDDFSAGYSIGSLWQWGQRVWRCYGDGQWDELMRNPSGAADGKLFGHVSGAPAWVNSPTSDPPWAMRRRQYSDQSLSGSVLSFNTASSFGGGCSSVSNYGIRVPSAGIYLLGYQGWFFRIGSGNNAFGLTLQVNGSTAYEVAQFWLGTPGYDTADQQIAWSTAHYLNANDYVAVGHNMDSNCRQQSGVFWCARIGG